MKLIATHSLRIAEGAGTILAGALGIAAAVDVALTTSTPGDPMACAGQGANCHLDMGVPWWGAVLTGLLWSFFPVLVTASGSLHVWGRERGGLAILAFLALVWALVAFIFGSVASRQIFVLLMVSVAFTLLAAVAGALSEI